jgi:hypothetical protein
MPQPAFFAVLGGFSVYFLVTLLMATMTKSRHKAVESADKYELPCRYPRLSVVETLSKGD